MLKINNFSYRYQSRKEFTLHAINLELASGEMLLLAGRSGCGKSTLIKSISGLTNDGEVGEKLGEIFLDDVKISSLSPEKIGVLVGTVYQSPDDQLFAMTVGDEVGFALENQGYDEAYIKDQVKQTLALVGLAGFEEYSIHKLSGGQRQRLALAAVLITKPSLLILDEPVSQMNPQGVVSFMELLRQLNEREGISILMVEHRVNELHTYFKRLAIMSEGRIIYDGAMEDAWQFLTGKTFLGLREPENVKLCRALNLTKLSSETEAVARSIQNECVLHPFEQNEATACVGQPLAVVKDLTFIYPAATEPTLKNLNFTINEGEILALMGFNGAGKSTLLNLFGGLTKVQKGRLELEGSHIAKALGKVGYLRQEPDLMLLADTVREELAWKNKAFSEANLQEFLQLLHLKEYANDFPLALSKGQRLRVVLGAMLAKSPRLLLLDEPTTGQDEASLHSIKKLLRNYKNNGGSVFICTHDVELASEIADRVLLLNNGEVLALDRTEKILANSDLLVQSGLVGSKLLDVSARLGLKACSTIEEVKKYVSPSTVGGQR
ncbi:MAG: ATP-binding cassette domain-containing protein [Phascolarctobacterium sp.]|nr:ATP-binding cassette domain-containing protein [Phascolarctobacterium sp.]